MYKGCSKERMEIEYKYTTTACRLVFDNKGSHIFGGPCPDVKFTGKELNQPLHHFLSIDLSDEYSPVEAKGLNQLPLLYPLKNSGGGGELQYQLISNEEIMIHHISDWDDIENFVEHNQFPIKKVEFQPLDYKTERILHALYGGFERDLNKADAYLIEKCDSGMPIRIGGKIQSCQGQLFAYCKNPECNNKDLNFYIPIICLCPAAEWINKFTSIDTWGEYPEDVEFCFCICQDCGTIHVENRCG